MTFSVRNQSYLQAIAGQEKVHEPWGGVVPGLARDAHSAKMDGVVEKALSEAGMTSVADVDAVAVTVRENRLYTHAAVVASFLAGVPSCRLLFVCIQPSHFNP